MPFVVTNRTAFSLGALIALLVLIAAFVLFLVGGVTTTVNVVMIAALAVAFLLG